MRLVLWDFDGTLAERPARWGGCIRQAATRLFPDVPLDELASPQHSAGASRGMSRWCLIRT